MSNFLNCLHSTGTAVVNIPVTILSRPYDIDYSSKLFSEILYSQNTEPNPSVAVSNKLLSMIFYSEDAELKPIICTFSLVAALFGAVHCLAWNFSFPTSNEQFLWRTASSTLVGACVAVLRAVFPWDPSAYPPGFRRRVCGCPLWAVGNLLFSGAACFYRMARITLLVLAIASLRSLPPSAFDTVVWIDFVPHI